MWISLHFFKFVLLNIPFTGFLSNLTNKGVMGYKWISEHCRNAEFVAKIDDDAFINFFKLFEEMQYLKDKKRYILARCEPLQCMRPYRLPYICPYCLSYKAVTLQWDNLFLSKSASCT
jgi:hypothetical protein